MRGRWYRQGLSQYTVSRAAPGIVLHRMTSLSWRAQATMDISLDSLARRGIFVSFGNASGAVPPFPVLRLIGKSAYVTR